MTNQRVELLSYEQLRVTMAATTYFRNMSERLGLHSMFRREGEGMSVGLALTVDTHHFIVRRHFDPFMETDALIAAFGELLVSIADSHINVMGFAIGVL